ncbi:MAG: zf-HC2 domain-containing protein [Pirellulaceae bacterium]
MNQHDDNWDACPDGELSRMVGQIRAARQRRITNRAAAGAATLLIALTVVGLTASWLGGGAQAEQPAPIACPRVRELLPAYTQAKLDSDLNKRIAHHLEHCPRCRQLNEQLQQQAAAGAPFDQRLPGRPQLLVAARR